MSKDQYITGPGFLTSVGTVGEESLRGCDLFLVFGQGWGLSVAAWLREKKRFIIFYFPLYISSW